MNELDEQLVDEMISALRKGADVSAWKKNRKTAPLLSLLSQIHALPRTQAPSPDFNRVRNQILDRISVPEIVETEQSWFMAMWPSLLRVGVTAIASILLMVSLGLGTAVAAMNSVPGEAIYPLKKVVENVQLRLASPDEKAGLQLKFADNRIDELQQVIDQRSQGKISDQDAQKIIAKTVQDFQQTTADAVKSAAQQPIVVTKLTDLSNKIKAASVQTEGDTKIELEKALEATQVSQEQAIKNIENAGLKIENQPIIIPDSVTTSGKISAVSDTSVSIGNLKFVIDENTEFAGTSIDKGLKIGQLVNIEGQYKDKKTVATKITLVTDTTDSTGTSSGAQTETQQVAPPSPNPEIIVIPENP